MDIITVVFLIFSFFIIYYVYFIIQQLREQIKLQHKSNELLYEINSGIKTLISNSRDK